MHLLVHKSTRISLEKRKKKASGETRFRAVCHRMEIGFGVLEGRRGAGRRERRPSIIINSQRSQGKGQCCTVESNLLGGRERSSKITHGLPSPVGEAPPEAGWVRHTNRGSTPQGGDLMPPFVKHNNDSPPAGIGEPPPKALHTQHRRLYDEHHDAFANPVGFGHQSSVSGSGPSDGAGPIRDNLGRQVHRLGRRDSPRGRRERDMVLARMSEAKALTPRERAVQQAAVDLTRASGGLDAKRLFENFDRNKDGTINFTSFSNGLRLAGVRASHGLQRELFDELSNGSKQMPYNKFVDNMKKRASGADTKTSLPIEDLTEAQRERREPTIASGSETWFLQRNASGERGVEGVTKRPTSGRPPYCVNVPR